MNDLLSSVQQTWRRRQPTIFRSARLKLTVFYLVILVVMSLVLTLSLRVLAQREFDHAGTSERGIVLRMLFGLYSVPPRSPDDFYKYQSDQGGSFSRHLNDDVILINLGVLVIGGLLSYWYAGRALRPIEEAHETQARFAADASHELRTPLASMRLENEIFLRQNDFSPTEARTLITSNLEEVQRLENLAANLLDLTQYEHLDLELSPISIKKVVEAAIEHTAAAAQTKHIKIEQTVSSVSVSGQFDSLVQLVGIVLDNAVKYSPKSTKVSVKGNKVSGEYRLRIYDQGPGIGAADLPYIFERLYRGDKSRTAGQHGYGLGLSLAREIARANGAAITARNLASGGAEFVISLTLA